MRQKKISLFFSSLLKLNLTEKHCKFSKKIEDVQTKTKMEMNDWLVDLYWPFRMLSKEVEKLHFFFGPLCDRATESDD